MVITAKSVIVIEVLTERLAQILKHINAKY